MPRKSCSGLLAAADCQEQPLAAADFDFQRRLAAE